MSWFSSWASGSLKSMKEGMQDTHHAAPGAVMPEVHTGQAAPASSLSVDQRGTELPDTPYVFGLARGAGRFRHTSRGVPTQADANFASTQDERAKVHGTRGSRDKRETNEVESGNPVAGELGHESSPWYFNGAQRFVLDIPHDPGPSRPRAGWTGEDGSHVAWMIRPLFNRPFDKNMAEHPITEKATQPSPRAFHSTQTDDLAQAFPSPGGWRGTHTQGAQQLRQAVRSVPGWWGADAVVDDSQVAVAAPASARGRFR